MSHIEPNQLLARYDKNSIMLGGGAAGEIKSLGNPYTFNFVGWAAVPEKERIPKNLGKFICDATYNLSDVEAKIKALTAEAKEKSIEVKVEEGFKISAPLVDKFFEQRLERIKHYSTQLDEIEGRIKGTEVKEGDYSTITGLLTPEGKLKEDGALPEELPDYVRGLVLQSFRAEYRGEEGKLIDSSTVRKTCRAKEEEYSATRAQLFERIAQLKQNPKFLEALNARKVSLKEES